MEINDLISRLRHMSIETGSITCLGCGHEHNCGLHGCAVLREAADKLQVIQDFLDRRDSDV